MPGNVRSTNAQGLQLMPQSLFSAYSASYTRHAVISEYPDGSTQRHSDVATTTRSWRFSKRLTASQRNALHLFYLDHAGKAFLFQDAFTGEQHIGVFTGPWQETGTIGRSDITLEVQEVY